MKPDAIARALDKYPTPFYLFDMRVLHETIEALQSALSGRAELCYAMKANPFILREALAEVPRVEVCSPGELRICQQMGVPASRIVVSGVHKDRELMHELILGGMDVCRYTVESIAQYDMLRSEAELAGTTIPVLLRLTSGNQFGLDQNDLRGLVVRASGDPNVKLCGIQLFSGTQKTSPKRLARELQRVDAFISSLEEEYGIVMEEFEYGAGLPVEYYSHDPQEALKEERGQLQALCDALDALAFKGKVVVELGRAIAAECGTYATRVVDTKRNKGHNYAIVDGGIHQLAYYGHAMALQQPVCSVWPERDNVDAEPWSVYGSLCTTNDVLTKQIPLSDVKVGDVMLFHRAGAYCMTEGVSLFLSRDLPRVLVCDTNGVVCLVRDRIETFEFNAPQCY